MLYIVIVTLVLPLVAFAADSLPENVPRHSRYTAVTDQEIPESVRATLDDDDGRPLKSISIDLNNDKLPEKLIPNETLCGKGGCPWIVYSPKHRKVIGSFLADAFVVLDISNGGYKSIQTYWNEGPADLQTAIFKFGNGQYENVQPTPNE